MGEKFSDSGAVDGLNLRNVFEGDDLVMSDTLLKIEWEPTALAKYNLMITKIPLFHREIARIVVDKKARLNAHERGSIQVEDQDIIRAFLSEVPYAFYSLMARLMDEVGFDYKKYESS